MFSLHPDLLRLTRVHTTVINVMKSYSNFNNSFQQTEVIKIQQKLRMIMSEVKGNDTLNVIIFPVGWVHGTCGRVL